MTRKTTRLGLLLSCFATSLVAGAQTTPEIAQPSVPGPGPYASPSTLHEAWRAVIHSELSEFSVDVRFTVDDQVLVHLQTPFWSVEPEESLLVDGRTGRVNARLGRQSEPLPPGQLSRAIVVERLPGAYDLATGRLLWEAPSSRWVPSGPCVEGPVSASPLIRVIGCSADDSRVEAIVVRLDPGSGSVLWTRSLGWFSSLHGIFPPWEQPSLIADGHLFLLNGNRLHAIDLSAGNVLWEASISVPPGARTIGGAVWVDAGELLVAFDEPRSLAVAAFDPVTGLSLGPRSSATYSAHHVRWGERQFDFESGGTRVVARNWQTGARLWKSASCRRGGRVHVAGADAVYVSCGRALWVIDPATGKRLASLRLPKTDFGVHLGALRTGEPLLLTWWDRTVVAWRRNGNH